MQLSRDAIFFHMIQCLWVFFFLRIVLINHRAIRFIKRNYPKEWETAALLAHAPLALAGGPTTLKVGVTAGPHAEIMEQVKKQAAAQGLDIQVVEFSDYVQPNAALASGDLQANSYQISMNTGFAPRNAIISAVAIKVKGVVMISSPGFISSAIKASSSASVPLLQAIACLAPLNLARFCSSSPTLPPI